MKHVKNEVWFLVKKDLCLKEIFVESFSTLGAACSYAEVLSYFVNDESVKKIIVYCNEECYRRKITSFDVKFN